MTRNAAALALVLFLAAPTVVALAKGGGSSPPPVKQPTKDDECAAYLADIAGKRQSQTDDEATASVKQLVKYWKDGAVKDATKTPIPGLLVWYEKRYDDKKKPAVAALAIHGLADIGGKGVQHLVQILDGLLMQKDPSMELLGAAFDGLKSAADPDATRTLFKILVEREPGLAGSALDALGGYAAAAPDAKKRVFEELLGDCETMSAVAAKGTDKAAVDKWTALLSPSLATLGALSRQRFEDLPAARKWLTDHARDPEAWKEPVKK